MESCQYPLISCFTLDDAPFFEGGTLIGMSGKKLRVILSGDSAYVMPFFSFKTGLILAHVSGGTLAVNVALKVLELKEQTSASHHPIILPLPTAIVLNYAALDFNFTSWMTADNLQVLRSEQSSGNLPGLKELAEQKDHLKHIVSVQRLVVSRKVEIYQCRVPLAW